MAQTTHPPVTTAGEGATYWTGFPNIIRLSGEETRGAFSVIEMRIPPGYEGLPHIHHNEHETFQTVEGQVVYTIGDDTIETGPGTIVHGPKGTPHSFRNDSETEANVLTWVHPAGFEEFMARTAERVTDPSNPPELDMERVLELAPEYGLEFLGPAHDAPDGGD